MASPVTKKILHLLNSLTYDGVDFYEISKITEMLNPSEKNFPQMSSKDIGIHILISKVSHLFTIEKISRWIRF